MKSLLGVLLCVSLLVACQKKPAEKNPSTAEVGNSVNEILYEYYKNLSETQAAQLEAHRAQYKDLNNRAYNLEQAAIAHAEQLEVVNLQAQIFVQQCEVAERNPSQEALNGVKDAGDKFLTEITALESKLISEWVALSKNTDVYSDKKAMSDYIGKRMKALEDQGNQLKGLRDLAQAHWKSVQVALIPKVPGYSASRSLTTTPVAPQAPSITITEKERVAASARTGQGVVVDRSTGKTSVLTTPREIYDYARANGYSVPATEHAYQMSAATGGFTAFSKSAGEISDPINAILANIKTKLNAQGGNLELVFAVDISGSMSNDIAGVIKGLVEITDSLGAVSKTRSVKIGIVSFGAPGREAVELPLTDNLVAVANHLKVMRDQFNQREHSTGPGEASYHGLKKVADGIQWGYGANRMVILITDEEAWEIAAGGGERQFGQKFVDGVMASLRKDNVQTNIYTIITRD